jgi:hypothetical protein
LLKWPAGEVHPRPVMGNELFFKPANHIGYGAINEVLVHDRLIKLCPFDAEELDVGAVKKAPRRLANHQEPKHGRNRLIRRDDHFRRRETLLGAAIIGFQNVWGDGGWKILRLEPNTVEIVERCRCHGLDVEGPIPMATLLIENALVLHRGDASARADADVDASLVPDRRRIRGPDRDDRHIGAVQRVFGNGQRWRGHDVAIGLDVSKLSQQLIRDR